MAWQAPNNFSKMLRNRIIRLGRNLRDTQPSASLDLGEVSGEHGLRFSCPHDPQAGGHGLRSIHSDPYDGSMGFLSPQPYHQSLKPRSKISGLQQRFRETPKINPRINSRYPQD